MSGAEGQDPVGTDPIDLQLPRSATNSGTPQTSTPSVARLIDTKSVLQVTPYHGDKASFLGWKWSFLIAVLAISKPLYEGFKKTEGNYPQRDQHDQLQEHPVNHAHLQALSLDKQRHQESLWRENLQSGGNTRTTTPTETPPDRVPII